MRVLILYANPNTKTFGAALHREVAQALAARGDEVDDCDLYAEAFDPIVSEQERANYHDTAPTGRGFRLMPTAFGARRLSC